MLPKKGQVIEFNFHAYRMTSQEETTVESVNENEIVISDGEPNYRFDSKTGKCLNDNIYMGCKRTLPKKYLI